MSALLDAVVLATSAVVAAHGLAWLLLAVVALPTPRPKGGPSRPVRIAVIVPAHNEEALVGRCIETILAGSEGLNATVLVVADNCTDRTPAVARRAGATVLERNDPDHRGKPYALNFALAHLRQQATPPELVVVVDGDSTVDAGFLRAMETAADGGGVAFQGYYRAEAGGTGLQRLRRLAFALAHWARPMGAARLGLGTTLKGNGMAFAWPLCREGLAWSGLAEDAAATVDLSRRGIAVRFVPSAVVTGPMASSYRGARVQDLRWESGRGSQRTRALAVAARALIAGRLAGAAGAFEVASLPFTRLGVLSVAACLLALATGGPVFLAAVAAALLALAVITGWTAARVPVSELLALIEAPRFVAHKLRVELQLAAGRGPRAWVRTSRNG